MRDKTIAKRLEKMLEILGPNGEHWCKGEYSKKNKAGDTCYCLVGGMHKVGLNKPSMSDDYHRAYRLIFKEIKETGANTFSVEVWNDRKHRKFSQVRDIVTRVIEKLRGA